MLLGNKKNIHTVILSILLAIVLLLVLYKLTESKTKSNNIFSDRVTINNLQKKLQLPDCREDEFFTGAYPDKYNLGLTCLSNDKKVNLKKLIAGKNTIINFWNYNCPPCVRELPIINEVNRSLPNGVQIITIHVLDNPLRVLQQMQVLGINLISLVSNEADLLAMLDLPRVVPQTMFLNKDGRVIKKNFIPYYEEKTLLRDIKEAFH